MPPLSACRLVFPPYEAEVGWAADPPLGTILIWRPGPAADIGVLIEAHATVPWCSLVVERPSAEARLDFNALFDALKAVACLPVIVNPGEDTVAAIRNRRPPDLDELVRYVARRPGHEVLGEELQRLAPANGGRLTPRSLRNHFNHCSLFGPGHWRWVIRLAQMKLMPGESAEALAGRYEMDVRTLRHRVRTCLNVSLEEFRHLVGWEWRVEAALRLDAGMRAESGGGGRLAES